MAHPIQTVLQQLMALGEQPQLWRQVEQITALTVAAFRNQRKLLLCGNGGSAADAQHVAGEFLCRFYHNRRPLPAMALTTDTSTITAIGNDFDFGDIFARQVEALGQAGDIILGISTSGNSENVRRAFAVARAKGITTILLTGQQTGTIAPFADHALHLPATDTPRIQEMMLLVEHQFCQAVEAAMMVESA